MLHKVHYVWNYSMTDQSKMERNKTAGRAMVRLLSIAHYQSPQDAQEALGQEPADELDSLAIVLLGALYAATVDLAAFHGVPVERFLRTLAFNVETIR